MFRALLDWMGWERLTKTKQRHQQIMSSLNQLNERLVALEGQITKAAGEITTEIANLREQLGNVQIPADAVATLERLSTAAQSLDDIVPDAPAPDPEVQPETPAQV